jgi:hypothetical protein
MGVIDTTRKNAIVSCRRLIGLSSFASKVKLCRQLELAGVIALIRRSLIDRAEFRAIRVSVVLATVVNRGVEQIEPLDAKLYRFALSHSPILREVHIELLIYWAAKSGIA